MVTRIEVEGTTATLDRDIDGGREELSCALPLVLSAQKELAEPRIPNMRGIMAARTKPLSVVEPVSTEQGSAFTSFELPQPKAGCKMIDPANAGELITLLRSEAKVI